MVKSWADFASGGTPLSAFDLNRFETGVPNTDVTTAGTVSGQTGLSAGITYRWNGSAWKIWDSWWTAVTGSSFVIPGATIGTQSARYRYRGGRVIVEGVATLSAGPIGTGDVYFPLPVNMESPSTAMGVGNNNTQVVFIDSSASTFFSGYGEPDNNSQRIYFKATGTNGQHLQPNGSVPFSTAWATGDSINFSTEYNPT